MRRRLVPGGEVFGEDPAEARMFAAEMNRQANSLGLGLWPNSILTRAVITYLGILYSSVKCAT